MKAAFMYGAGDVRVETVDDPTLQEPTDAIIRTVRSCVCGSDLHPFHTMPAAQTGSPMGHEVIGIVEETGAEVTTLTPGDLVISSFTYQDNTCVHCREGFHVSCLHGGFFGGQGIGLQAEYVRVPQADGTLVVVPGVDETGNGSEDLLASLLSLSDVYLTGYHAAHMGRVGRGTTVTVVGDGAVGLSAVLASRQLGAERIILMGRHTARTDLGREFGATDVVSERGPEGIDRVRDLTSGEGTHVVIEAVGHLPAHEQALGAVRAGGTISRVGVPQFAEAPLGGRLFRDSITLTGGTAPVRAYIERAMPGVLSGEITPGRVFDRSMPLDQAPEAYAAMDAREALKVMLVP
ncbi:alcohol dehydrogenase catalytic domain-containing protein [Citricoccus sp. CH26A]|uniref:alcohol dehydrogenase catalytic domain-containing protein n=1 Tax=Citricoccus TaxID=169133 RepID=UPI0002EA8F88|nr:alcohol dehydrogenase catalytic domain-containing protein [Citricoccus sp. CH26A]